jgi:hypothetical protein
MDRMLARVHSAHTIRTPRSPVSMLHVGGAPSAATTPHTPQVTAAGPLMHRRSHARLSARVASVLA